MNTKNYPKYIGLTLLALTLLCASFVVLTSGFMKGQTPAGVDYAVFEGVAGNDHYDSSQYSFKINEWAYNNNLTGYNHTTQSLQNITNPGNVYFNASKSLRVGLTENGEFATSANAGIAYGANAAEWGNTESWASSAIDPKYWIQGWLLFVNYTRAGVPRALEAYSLYSDMNNTEAGRAVYTWYANYTSDNPYAYLTVGSLANSGIMVLYDSARLLVARASVTIHDASYNEDFAKITFTIVFNKDTKAAIVYKDVKILLDTKVLDAIVDFAFSERYELDLARGVNPTNRAYVHYYQNYSSTVYQHPLTGANTYDALQAFDINTQYIYFAGYWPNTTECSVYGDYRPSTPGGLVPDVPHGYTKVLPPGTGIADLPSPPGEPGTPWVIAQWRYNYTNWPHMLTWLAKQSPQREIRFVEVMGMTDYNSDPHPAMDTNATSPANATNQLDTEVMYLLNQTIFNPEDLTNMTTSPSFMWTGLGQSASTTDSAGAGLVSYITSPQWYSAPFMLFDRNDTLFPWTWSGGYAGKGTIPYGLDDYGGNYYETFSNSGAGTGTDPTVYKRNGLKGFAFNVYDDVAESPPQPIAGGWSAYNGTGYYWYPSKDPLTERWFYNATTLWSMVGYDHVTSDPNGILSLGGSKANGLTRYFNDFGYAISREGTSAYALINGGTVTGSAPTSDFALGTFDYFPISTWASSNTTFSYTSGYAVISLVRDINGTKGLAIYGWDGRDTFWAAAWASQYLGNFSSWIPRGTVALVLNIGYTAGNREPTGFTIVKALGTITEFGSNAFLTVPGFGFDRTGVVWTGSLSPLPYPTNAVTYQNVWWYKKLGTTTTAAVQFDP